MRGEAPRGGAPLHALPMETQGSSLPRVSAPWNQHPEPQPEHFWHLKWKNWLHTRRGAINIQHIKQITVRLSKPFIVTNPKSYDFRCTHLRDLPIFSGFLKRRKKITIFQNTLYARSVQEQAASISPIFWNCRNRGKVNNRYQTQLILWMHIRVICFLLKSIQKSVYSLQIWHVSKIQAYLHPSVSTGQIYLNTLSMDC